MSNEGGPERQGMELWSDHRVGARLYVNEPCTEGPAISGRGRVSIRAGSGTARGKCDCVWRYSLVDTCGTIVQSAGVCQKTRAFKAAPARFRRGQLREDAGLKEMLGHDIHSPEAARKFLYQFHDEKSLEQAQSELPAGQVSYIPQESVALRGLAQVNQELVQEIGKRCAEQKIATIDLDATIIESWKKEARATYQGGKGYQPMLALWAEMDLVVAEEFRDGNVPAHSELLPIAKRAFQALPSTVNEYLFRGDSACWDQNLVTWLRNEKRADGPRDQSHSPSARA